MFKKSFGGGEYLNFTITPDEVPNYQKKVDKLYKALNPNSTYQECLFLVLISEEVNTKIQKITKKKTKINAYLITINSKTNTSIEDLVKCVDRAKVKKWIALTKYCYEQRSETIKEFKGFHCHMLVIGNRKKYKTDIINEFFNTCKNIATKGAINVKYLKTQKDVDKVTSYIRGEKADKLKQVKIDVDKVFRKKSGLNEFYEFSN